MAGRKRAFEETEEQGTSVSAPPRGRGRPRLASRIPGTTPATAATLSTSATRGAVRASARARRATILDHTAGQESGHDSDGSEAEAENVGNAEDIDADAGPGEFIAAVEHMEVDLPPHITSHNVDQDGDIATLAAPTTNSQGNTIDTYRRELLRWKVWCLKSYRTTLSMA